MKTRNKIEKIIYASTAVFAAVILAAVPAPGQNEFLRIDAGVRAVGMGGAYCSVADDAQAGYWNPAGVAKVEKHEVTLSRLVYLADITSDYADLALPMGWESALGINVAMLSVGDLALDDAGNPDGSFSVQQRIIGVNYATYIGGYTSDSAIGIGFKAVSDVYPGSEQGAVGVDLGIVLELDILTGFMLGVSAQNISTGMSLTGDTMEIPGKYRAGLSTAFLGDTLLVAGDVEMYSDNDRMNIAVGVEFRTGVAPKPRIAVRAGLNTTYTEEVDQATGISMGIGLHEAGYGIDYASTPFGILGDVHRISFTARFK